MEFLFNEAKESEKCATKEIEKSERKAIEKRQYTKFYYLQFVHLKAVIVSLSRNNLPL